MGSRRGRKRRRTRALKKASRSCVRRCTRRSSRRRRRAGASRSYLFTDATSRRRPGSQVGGATRVTLGAEGGEQQDVAARDTRVVQHVADDRDPAVLEVAGAAARWRRIVNASSSACRVLVRAVAGSSRPSRRSSRSGRGGAAPLEPWRITTASAPMASRVSAGPEARPDTLAEPLGREVDDVGREPLAAALERDAGRVESSKNRLTTVRPRRVGSF